MKEYTRALFIIDRLVLMIEDVGITDWSLKLRDIVKNNRRNELELYRNILSLYGGLGSLNDLILYRDGKLLLSENNEFDQLRTELHKLCFTERLL